MWVRVDLSIGHARRDQPGDPRDDREFERELWIEDRKRLPGGYHRSEPGTSDTHVWSETGCTCVLVTSFSDVLR